MKNQKEVQPIITSIFALAHVAAKNAKETADSKVFEEIRDIAEFAIGELFGSNCNMLMLACIGQTNNSITEQVQEILKQDTAYIAKGDK